MGEKAIAKVQNDVAISTDSSKLEGKIVSKIRPPTLSTNFNVGLPDYSSIAQAELIAITEAAEWLLGSLVKNESTVSIYSDSQAATYHTKGGIEMQKPFNQVLSKM